MKPSNRPGVTVAILVLWATGLAALAATAYRLDGPFERLFWALAMVSWNLLLPVLMSRRHRIARWFGL